MIVDNYGNEYESGYTHCSPWHADELFASAVFILINEKFPIRRQANRKEIAPNDEKIIVYDVGYGKHDHHELLGTEVPRFLFFK